MKHFFAYLWAVSSLLAGACARLRNRQSVVAPLWLRTYGLLGLLLGSALSVQAQQFFQDDAAATRQAAAKVRTADEPRHARYLTLNVAGMRAALATAPLESSGSAAPLVLTLPLPDGTAQHFRVVESSVMAPALAAQFPQLKTYTGVGVEDPTATIRFDLTQKGFHAQILTNTGKAFYIEPVSLINQQQYLSFFRKDLPAKKQVCGVTASASRQLSGPAQRTATPQSSGAQLRTYRLAVAATGEYTQFMGGTVADAMAGIVTTVNAVVGEYERELAVRLILVNNNNLLIYTNAATDPYSESSSTVNSQPAMLGENQANVNAVIGNANYDIGHVFCIENGGLAAVGVVCNNSHKGEGVTGIDQYNAVGTAFVTDYVAHEFGHQFGSAHNFNSGGACVSNRSANTAYEPGSGTTTMCYAGVCGLDDVQGQNDFNFHIASYEQIQDYLATTTCGLLTATGNSPPVVATLPAGGLVLPIGTPFKLTASGTDANGDPLTYAWQEYDLGPAKARRAAQIAGQTPPLFRSFYPTTSPTRYFPQLDSLVANVMPIDDQLPTVARALNFRVMLRDMHTGSAGSIGGQTSSGIVALSVTSAAGPFLVSAPNTAVTWAINSTQTVTWAVAGTNANGVNCANVNIRLSTDGGFTYPTVLLANTPNDGTQAVVIPNTASTTARVMVEAVGNYFFDISNTNFSITPAPACAAHTALAVSGITATSASVAFTASSTAASYTVTTSPATTTQTVTTSPVALTGLAAGTAYTVSFVSNCTSAATATSPAATATFTTTQAAPTITSLTPNTGAAGTSVTVAGTNFMGATGLTFNGTTAAYTVVSATSITTTVPVGATTGNVVVTTPGGTASSPFTVTAPATLTTWTAGLDQDWFNALNWTAGVPTSSLDALIPSGVRFYPVMSSGSAVTRALTNQGTITQSGGSLTVGTTLTTSGTITRSGGTLAVSSTLANSGTITQNGGDITVGSTLTNSNVITQVGGTVTVNGDLVNNGPFTTTNAAGTGGGTVILGTTAQVNGPNLLGSTAIRFWNLSVQANGVRLGTSAGASVRRVLTLTGSLTTQGNVFTVESASTGDALVVNSGGVVLGAATVQRYINPTNNSGLGYRHYSTPVSNTSVSDLATSGFTPVVNATYNTSATPYAEMPFPTVYGYDESRLVSATNNLVGFDKGYSSPAALSSALTPGRGYTVNIGGTQLVDFVGTLNNGDLSLTLSNNRASNDAAGWHLVGNPYPAPLDYRLVVATDRENLEAAIYIFSSTSQFGGQYRAYTNGIGNPIIPLGQGFFTRVSNATTVAGTMKFHNVQRQLVPQATTFQRPTAEARPLVQLTLQGVGSSISDDAYVYFEAGATAGTDGEFDALKLPNTNGLSLAALAGSQEMAISGLPLLGTASLTVPLMLRVPATGTYVLNTTQLLNMTGQFVYLHDSQLGTFTDLRQQASYSFTLSAANTGARFELIFSPQQPLATVPVALAQQVAVYPNPAHAAVAIELPAALNRQPVTATLVDALGRTVRTQVLPAGLATHALSLTGIATGVYALRLTTEAGIVVKKLLID